MLYISTKEKNTIYLFEMEQILNDKQLNEGEKEYLRALHYAPDESSLLISEFKLILFLLLLFIAIILLIVNIMHNSDCKNCKLELQTLVTKFY